ncbi:hypothetical protein LWI28_001690 [Acer negundo]|uniref:Protein kinase domain-containing protein n=1 Tax=Acer negundo TaxID=4023 RepID=A0AAD5JT21_ACENE|nr:hypothetical protein LWI28_001690 [Acer negundo]
MLIRRKLLVQNFLFFLLNIFLLISSSLVFAAHHSPNAVNFSLPSDAKALIAFKSKADLRNHLLFSPKTSLYFCQWQGVICYEQRVVRLVLENLDLGGIFTPNSLIDLDQLRVLSLQNNSLTGPVPDLSRLVNLKTLFLDHNFFTGNFPLSILSLHRLKTIDLSYNNLTGPIPKWLASIDRLYSLRLDVNRFNGSIPPLNQSSLRIFNVSVNNLTGAIPVTPILSRFGISSFLFNNPDLCGEIIHKECHPSPPFFGTGPTKAAPPPVIDLGQSAEVHGVELTQPGPKKHNRIAVIIGFSSGIVVLIGSIVCFAMAVKNKKQKSNKGSTAVITSNDAAAAAEAAAIIQLEQENELEEKVKRMQGMQVAKSGNLIFCAGEAHLYTLDQLMRASAESLGKGTLGSTYKAVLDHRLIVCVKRLDAAKLAGTSSRSTRAKPLHWTSCLKIAEDVAQGLSYIHQAWRLVHGNLKSSNVLLGPDFEACLADYCLAALSNSPPIVDDHDPTNNLAYKAPETRDGSQQSTSKSDVYSFGVLLLELLTGKPASQHDLTLEADEMLQWVKSTREDDAAEDDRLAMLLEVAMACILTSPEQRPTMWQVLKMLQEIKEAVLMEDGELDPHSGMS